jgi:hypothetical protein
VSREQDVVATALESIEPKPGLTLVGLGLMAEWQEPEGSACHSPRRRRGHPWQVKGYVHDGLNYDWPATPEPAERHNPGHPIGRMRVG